MSSSIWKVLGALILISLVVAACGGGGSPVTVKETVPVPQTVIVPQTVVVQAPTIAPVAAVTPAPKPVPPIAVLDIVPVAANLADPNAITTTIKFITDTTVGLTPPTKIALGTAGLANTPIGVPVHLAASPQNPTDSVTKVAWTLTAPQGSKAAIKDKTAAKTEFTPDIPGMYKLDVVLSNSAGDGPLASVTIHAGTYIGVTAGNCKNCHADKVDEWAKTGHGTIFTDNVNNSRTPKVATHYSESCIRCHTTGYYPGVKNGGFGDVQAALNWLLPTFKQIDAGGAYAKVPDQIKNMGNIQCEDCHGPAKEHVASGAKVMAVSFDNGSCDQCHAGGGHHIKGIEITFSKHSDASSQAWTHPTGPAEQACVRCHSGAGYASFIKDPTNQASWDNSAQTVGCASCHDPHSEKNPYQLRAFGTPVQVPADIQPKDVGLSATCFECHNNRTDPANAVKGSFPHYSSAAELLSNTGGVTYGQTIKDSPHALMVGAQPILNPAFAKDPTVNQFMFSKAGDTKGNVPGPCVTCHMTGGLSDSKDPNYMKVGEHSFNMTSPDGKFDYTAACKTCHGDIKDFNLPAKADYDGNGKVEGVQDEVKGLLNVLWKALADKGFKKVDTGYPYATVPKDASGNIDPKIANAWYNFRVVYGVMWGSGSDGNQGKGAAVHNFNRAVQLLQLSYKDLTGQDVPGATILK